MPLVLGMIFKTLTQQVGTPAERAQAAIELIDAFKITNDMFKEHLLDLCMSKSINTQF